MKKIVLDPGHGGLDPGAVAFNLKEKWFTWDIANLVGAKMKNVDAQVTIIQPSASNPNSTARDEIEIPVREANRIGADFFLSIHVNAGGGTGFESYVHNTNNKTVSDGIRNSLHYQIMQYLKGYNVIDRGKKYANFAVLRNTKMPAVLLECLFIDNERDIQLLTDQTFMAGLANEIAYGLIVSLKLELKK